MSEYLRSSGTFRRRVVAMQSWVLWLIVAAVLGTAELMTATFDLLLLAVAALAAAAVGGIGLGIAFQVLAFAVTAAAMVTLVRPVARRHLTGHPGIRTGVAALIGREAVVLAACDRDDGRVRIGGEEWSARSYDPDLHIPAGTRVDVFAIEGATALVHPQEEPWPN